MRADRLVAIVLLLQVHGRMTARDIADRLETSERSIRRDLDSLAMAGVPVYAQRGRQGGWSLLGGHRIDLTGLTADEAQALVLAAESGSATLGPGFGDGLAAARRKVLAALPEPLRASVDSAAGTVLVDRTQWGPPRPSPDAADDAGDPALVSALRRAVVAGRQVVIGYEPPSRPVEDRRLHPHGLVCKRGVWYLVASAPNGLRTYRVSRVRSVEVTDDPVIQPDGFDLAGAWEEMQRAFSFRDEQAVVVEVGLPTTARRRVEASLSWWWPVEEARPEGDGRTRMRIRFPSVAIAASALLPVAEQLDLVEPEPVRRELAAAGRRLAARFGGPGVLPLDPPAASGGLAEAPMAVLSLRPPGSHRG